MFIHPKFKEELKKIHPQILEMVSLQDIDNIPNEEIITKLKDLMVKDSLQYHMITTEGADREYLHDIIGHLKTIDDEYFWPDIEKRNAHREANSNRPEGLLTKRTWFAAIVNSLITIPNGEPEVFAIWKIVRVCSGHKLKNLNLYRTFLNYMKKYYKVEAYASKPERNQVTIFDFSTSRFKPVWCSDVYWNIYCFPQAILLPTSVKDLVAKDKEIAIEKIKENLLNNKKFQLEQLTTTYQTTLRDFMESSKKLYQKQIENVDDEANRLYDISLNMKEYLLKNKQIDSVNYIPGTLLEVYTQPLWCDGKPIGKYMLSINLCLYEVKAFNLDIANVSTAQHPHVNSWWKCCLGDYANGLQEAYKQWDYVTLVNWLIEFLENIYDRSVFVGMDVFQKNHGAKFKYQLPTTNTQAAPDTVDLVDVATSTVNENRSTFNLWDMVQIVTDSQNWHPIWTVWTIVDIINETTYKVNSNWISFEHNSEYLIPFH